MAENSRRAERCIIDQEGFLPEIEEVQHIVSTIPECKFVESAFRQCGNFTGPHTVQML